MTSGERKLKEGKHQKEQRALAVARAQSFAYSVVAYDADRWELLPNCPFCGPSNRDIGVLIISCP